MLLLAPGAHSKAEIIKLQGQDLVDYTSKVTSLRDIAAKDVKELYEKYAKDQETWATTKANRLAWIIGQLRMSVPL